MGASATTRMPGTPSSAAIRVVKAPLLRRDLCGSGARERERRLQALIRKSSAAVPPMMAAISSSVISVPCSRAIRRASR